MDAVSRRIAIALALGLAVVLTAPAGASAATISGTLTNASNGGPAAGVCVGALTSPGEAPAGSGTLSSSTGTYTITGLSAGTYRVVFTTDASFSPCPGGNAYATEYWNDSTTFAGGTDITLTAAEDRTGVNASLMPTGPAPTTGSVAGRLVSRVGIGLEQVCIGLLDPSTGGLSTGTFTNAQGEYALGSVTPGSYKVIFITDPVNCPASPPKAVVTEYYDDESSFATADVVTVVAGGFITANATLVLVDDPVAADDSPPALGEDASATALPVLANDTDDDGDTIAVTQTTQPANGTVVITGGGTGLTYTPAANYCNSSTGTPDTFTYTVSGGDTATVSVTVNCVDDDPVAVNDTATIAEDATSTVIDVLANDTDADGGTAKSVDSKTDPAHGTVNVGASGTNVTYTPAANYCGSDSFTYKLAPGTSTATVSVTVTCSNDAASAVDDTKIVVEDSGANTIDVRSNDTDFDTLNAGGTKDLVTGKTNGGHGTVAITNGGADLSYTPNANYCGDDTFTYTVAGGDSATVGVSVACVEDNPVAVNDAKTVGENSGVTAIDVLANDTDVDGGAKVVGAKTNGSHGAVSIGTAGANVSYTPDADFCGNDSFTYTLNGGSSASVAITVTCAAEPTPDPDPDPPVIPGPGPDTQAPDVRIVSGPSGKTKDTTPTFAFSSGDASARFTCSVDGGSPTACTSPFTTVKLKKGKHTFTVVARDAAGNASPPASQAFTVKKKKKRR